MNDYNPNELKSTLLYVKKRFGTDAFVYQGRICALVSDLAPALKNERVMLDRLSRLGIIEEIINGSNADNPTKRRIISKNMSRLTQSEYIMPSVAASYLALLTSIFEWNLEVDVPTTESHDGKMQFDSNMYFQDVKDSDYVLGEKAILSDHYEEAKYYFSKAYGRGNTLAGVLLGIMHYQGEGVKKDYKTAIPLFIEGMDKGCPLAAEWYAEAYRTGNGVPIDKEKAQKTFDFCSEALETMAASGSVFAQYIYGFDLLYGNFTKKKEKTALYWLERALAAGMVRAGAHIAKMYLYGLGIEKDEKKGTEILEKFDGSQDRIIHYELGKMYYLGAGKEKNYNEALKHFLISGKQGYANAQDYLGDIFRYGEGTEKNLTEAVRWYELAEEQGNVSATVSLGFLYLNGDGMDRDLDKSFSYFHRAADKGNARAQYILHSFFIGEGKYKNLEKGREYLEKSANQNDVLAQKELAYYYGQGVNGFDRDLSKAVVWLEKAAEQNDVEAQRTLGEICVETSKHFRNDGDEERCSEFINRANYWLARAASQMDLEAAIDFMELNTSGLIQSLNETDVIKLLKNTELMISEASRRGEITAVAHKKLGNVYERVLKDNYYQQIAFDHYCIAFSLDPSVSAIEVGRMFFVQGYSSVYLNTDAKNLIVIIREQEKKSKAPDMALLLGLIYYYGLRVQKNKPKAERWFFEAKEKGSAEACCKLAHYYIDDLNQCEKGFELLMEAYNLGSVEGTRLLGICFKKGVGVRKNRAKAKELLKEAANKGDNEAAEELKKFWL